MEQQTPPKRMLRCPYCHYDDIEFITEYHKADVARFWKSLMAFGTFFCLFLLFCPFFGEFGINVGTTFKVIDPETLKMINAETLLAFAIIDSFIWLGLRILIIIVERRTHVQGICRICGNIWLIR